MQPLQEVAVSHAPFTQPPLRDDEDEDAAPNCGQSESNTHLPSSPVVGESIHTMTVAATASTFSTLPYSSASEK